MNSAFPRSFDPDFYRNHHQDLTNFPDELLIDHYARHGISEGRVSCPVTDRKSFLQLVPPEAECLEIGPFVNPCLRRPAHNVRYFDVLDTRNLVRRAEELLSLGIFPEDPYRSLVDSAPDIDFVHPTGDLSAIDVQFDFIISSHSGEHQSDFIDHLNHIHDLLRIGGYYLLILPDKRYGFDHYLPETRLIDLLGAHFEQRKLHPPTLVLEHRLETTHNDPVRHWGGDHGEKQFDRFDRENPDIFDALWHEARYASLGYVDVHAWKFTPENFRHQMEELRRRGFLKLDHLQTYHTVRNSMEFYSVLRKT